MDVIEIFVNCDFKIMYMDFNNLIVLYYCVGFFNDDKICVEYMRIILEKYRKYLWIGKVDVKGDMVLSIVVKCEIYSRV